MLRKTWGVLCALVIAYLAIGYRTAASGQVHPAAAEGFITEWLVCGPFSNAWHEGYYKDYLLDAGGEREIEPKVGMSHPSEDIGRVRWQAYVAEENGTVNFQSLWRLKYGLAYAFTNLQSEEKKRVLLVLGRNDGTQIWLNHELIYDSRPYWPGEDVLIVELEKGSNPLLVKASRLYGGWGFALQRMEVEGKLLVKEGEVRLPDLRVGEKTATWGSLPVVNISAQPIESVEVEVMENDLFSAGVGRVGGIAPGQTRHVAFWLATKREVESGEEVEVDLEVRTADERHPLSLEVRVRNPDEYFTTTYRSSVDGSVQPYDLLVPTSYDGTSSYPLIVTLHGLGVGVGGMIRSYSLKEWCIMVAPYGRGQTGYREIGRVDVFEVMEEVKGRYIIDEDRVYLTGHSMGGLGTWYLGLHHPDRFAAIAPLSAISDYRLKIESRTNRHLWMPLPFLARTTDDRLRIEGVEAEEEKFPDYQVSLLEEASPVFFPDNALNLPVFCAHGAEDDIVRVEHARRMIAALRELDYPHVEYIEEPDEKHWWGADMPEKFAFFQKHRRNRNPKEVVYKTNDLRSNQAYWVGIDELRGMHKMARIHAEIVEGNRIDVEMVNIAQYTLRPNQDLVDMNQPLLIHTNGLPSSIERIPRSGKVTVRARFNGKGAMEGCAVLVDANVWTEFDRGGNIERYVAGKSAEGLRKTPDLCGPIADAFNSPFMLVYGTRGEDRKEIAVNREEAYQVALNWRRWANGDCEVKGDAEVTPQDIDHYNLILYGGPRSNALVARINDLLPIRFEGSAIVVGEERFRGEDVGVKMIYPNPLNPDRYVVINAGITWKGTEHIDKLDRFVYLLQPHLPLPDYVIFDEKTFVGGGEMLAAGFFDNKWELGE